MSKKTNGVNWSKHNVAKDRRVIALHSLESTLKRGFKLSKNGKKEVPLDAKDIKRIELEIVTVKGRI
jgi:hypothetical protein